MPALVAVRCDQNVKACYDALVARGKRPKQAIVAVMRKLLHALWGMLKHARDFEANRFFQMPQKEQKTA